jgi:hypothetical protein
MSIRPRDRFLTFKRDNFTCQYCGRQSPEVVLECDHVIARATGGQDEIGNYITSCRLCNGGKGKTPVIDFSHATEKPIEEKPEDALTFTCDLCGIGIFEGDAFEGWDKDTFCLNCAGEWRTYITTHPSNSSLLQETRADIAKLSKFKVESHQGVRVSKE